jgi:hypothetical protein
MTIRRGRMSINGMKKNKWDVLHRSYTVYIHGHLATCTMQHAPSSSPPTMPFESPCWNNKRHRKVRTDDTVWYESDQYNTKRIAFIIRRDAILSSSQQVFRNSVGQFEVVANVSKHWLFSITHQTGIFSSKEQSYSNKSLLRSHFISPTKYLSPNGWRPRHWMVM